MEDRVEPLSPSPVIPYYQNVRREISPLLPQNIDTILEIGCGAGATMKWLRSSRTVRYAAGVEMFAEAAEIARQTFDAIEVSDVNSARLEFIDEPFDLILALDVLEHLPHPESVIRRLKSKLRPGGTIVASVPNVAHISVSLPLLLRGTWQYQDGGILDRTHLRFFNKKSVVELFESAGFEIRRIDFVRRPPDIFGLLSHPRRSVRWWSLRMLTPVFRWPKHLFIYQFLISARRS